MTGAHIAVAEIAKITAMIAHDHQSSSGVTAGELVAGGWFVSALTRRGLGMVHFFLVTCGGCAAAVNA